LFETLYFSSSNPSYEYLNEGEAWAWRIQQYLEFHQLKTKFYSSASFNAIDTAVKQGNNR
jgi:hypothetical protein